MEVRTNLTRLRTQRGIAAARLAGLVGISRQTVYAIEAGTYVPNTAVSLKLARVLDTTVEELFQLEAESAPVEEILEATVIAELDTLDAGQLMRVCRVGKSVVAVPAESSDLGLPSADGALLDPVRKARGLPTARVRVVNDKWRTTLRLLIAGCDPSVSILAQSLQAQGCELLVAYGNSSRALELLHADLAHVAGTHLVDSGAEASDLRPITSMFGRNSLAVIAYRWCRRSRPRGRALHQPRAGCRLPPSSGRSPWKASPHTETYQRLRSHYVGSPPRGAPGAERRGGLLHQHKSGGAHPRAGLYSPGKEALSPGAAPVAPE